MHYVTKRGTDERPNTKKCNFMQEVIASLILLSHSLLLLFFNLLVVTVSVPGLLVPSLRLAFVSWRKSGCTALHPGLEAPAQ